VKLRGTASGKAQIGPSFRIVAGMISINSGIESLLQVGEDSAEEDTKLGLVIAVGLVVGDIAMFA
jgi:hypothetical protein